MSSSADWIIFCQLKREKYAGMKDFYMIYQKKLDKTIEIVYNK